MKTKEHKESNGCEKYHCWRYALYKINFWTILKKLLQKNDFRRFPLFEIFAQIWYSQQNLRDTVHPGHLRLSSVLPSTFIFIEMIFSTIFYGCCPICPPPIIISISINIIMLPTIERIMIMYHNIMMMSHPFFQFSRTIVGDFEDTSFVEV